MLTDKKEEKKFLDLLVKIKRVFTTEIYIYNCSEIYPGEKSAANLAGNIVLTIEESLSELLKKVFRNNAGEIQNRIYIENIDNFKKGLISYKSFELENEIPLFDDAIKESKDLFYEFKRSNSIWSKFKLSDNEEDNAKLMDRFFTDKLIVDLQDPDKMYPKVMIGASMLPVVTNKLADNLLYTIEKYEELDNETIYTVKFILQFTHFEISMQYFFI